MKNINRVKKIIKNQTTKIFFICLVLPVSLNFFPIIKKFPDYYAYETMFYDWEKLPNINWGPLYILLNQAFRYSGLDYSIFRIFLYLICAVLITLSYFCIKRNFYQKKIFSIYVIIGFLISIEFYIEFLLIRIRSGLSISIATLGICLYIAYRNLFLALLLIAIAYFVHSFSAIVVACILLPAYLSKFRENLSFNLALVFLGTTAIFCGELASQYRGDNVYSKLNIYRFIAIAPLTLLISFINIKFFINNKMFNNFDYFIENLIKLYLSLMCGLFIVFTLGFLNNSGEGLLRIVYIFDIFWIFSLILSESRYRLTIAYIATVNAFFFVYAVFIR